MIIFKNIKFENFLSFNGKHEYVFPLNGIHWITGRNHDDNFGSIGSGKTSFTFVIQYALFGIIEKKLAKKDQIINKKAKKDLMVQLEFSVDGVDYRITRYRHHSDFDNLIKLETLLDGEWKDITSTSADATQKEIDTIISITPETFLKTILYSREDDKHFFKLTNSERIKIFENIIQSNKFNKYTKKAKEKNKEITKKIIEAEKQEVSLDSVYKLHVKNAKEEKENIDNKSDDLKRKIKKLKEKDDVTFTLDEYEKALSALKALEQAVETLDDELDALTDNSSEIRLLEKNVIKYETRIENQNTKIVKQLKKIDGVEPIKCSNCGSIQNEEEFNETIAYNKETYDDYVAELNDFSKTHKEYKDKLLEVKQAQEKYDLDYNVIDSNKTKAEKKLKQFKSDNKEVLKLTKDVITAMKDRDDTIKTYQIQLDSLNYDNVDKFTEDSLTAKDKLKIVKDEILKLKEERDMILWWIDALDMKNEDSIKNYIITRVIPVFNNILKKNLDSIFDGSVSITVDALLNETIMKDNKPYNYSEFSSGEKFKINFCANFSMFDMTNINLVSSNLIFFDDVFINIDLQTTIKILDIIKNKYVQNTAVYIISHDMNVQHNTNPLTKTVINKKHEDSYIEILE